MPEESLVARLREFAAKIDGLVWPSDTDMLREAADALERAPLSFLDMDEAGVERMRLAVKAAFGASNHDELYEVEADEIARAVLAELRKMAGEKE